MDQLTELGDRVRQTGARLRIQQPVSLPPGDEPEPGAAIVADGDYRRARHPGAADIFCLVEVANISLRYDRTTKQRVYADHSVGQFVIVNLVEGVVEDYRRPAAGAGRYDSVTVLGRGQTLALEAGGGHQIEVPVATLLP